jgi:hypothetical protein
LIFLLLLVVAVVVELEPQATALVVVVLEAIAHRLEHLAGEQVQNQRLFYLLELVTQLP